MPQEFPVAFEAVTKRYPPSRPGGAWREAVIEVGFRVEPGEIVGLLGPNRSGKTTLAKLLLSLCRPTSGRVTRLGRPASDRATLARVGYVPERAVFPGHLTATELLSYLAALSGVSRAVRRRRIPALLDRVGLLDRGREPISQFSKGMVQRLAIAQALANDPDLLVLDEPTEGMDLSGFVLLEEILVDASRAGKTAVLITHLPGLAERLCDRLAVLRSGRLVFLGSPTALRSRTDPGRSLGSALLDLDAGAA
ncbi:ABC transporter ATP-binding protein [Tautonia sociabilis]|uniref:ABC transporter ATP-binding protein n=1 Tax=Tautonia sociabilis TaxID=2080755 RepID=A0A432MM13_9BACT|nr:ABC transporter ATP-binding protein [Tautonia sociabilis]RUL88237.1 ABC transporter ATP-binding protein [Tautonia sociabilis]